MKKTISVLLAVIMLFSATFSINMTAFAEELYKVKVQGTCDYTKAYEVLELVNKERAAAGLSALKMDEELLDAAMTRALETGIYFDHTRPDGTSCFKISSKVNGENIAAGSSTAIGIMTQWMNSPSHKANILTSNYKSIGIGCFKNGDTYFWVQCFSTQEADKVISKSGTVERTDTVSIKDEFTELYASLSMVASNINYMLVTDKGSFLYGIVNAGWKYVYSPGLPEDYIFSTSDSSVISINSKGEYVAVGEGTATISVALKADPSKSFSRELTVKLEDISSDKVRVKDIDKKYAYTGKEITPVPTIVYYYTSSMLNERTLVEGVDYTLKYINNTNVGTATLEITGIGKYTGTRTVTFEIFSHPEHSYVGFVIKEPTCSQEGLKRYYCPGCSDNYYEPIPKTAHTEVKDAAVAPTCTQTGLTEGSHCSVCNEVIIKQQVVPVSDHTYKSNVIKAATCIEEGIMEYRCAGCGDSYKESIAKTAHKAVKDAAVEATCSKTGLTEGSHCSVCNTVIVKQQVIPVTDHKYNPTVAKEATCIEEGIMEYRCAGCGDSYTESIAKTAHKAVKDAAVAPTCTKTGLTEGSHCSVCNEVIVAQQTVPVTAHTVVKDAAVAPTCTKTGLTEGSHCSVCNEVIVAQQTVPMTEHTVVTDAAVEPTCSKTGLTEGSHCSVCNKVIVAQQTVPMTEHTVVTDAAVDPTCTQTGLTEGSHCSVCETIIVKQVIVDATGHNFVYEAKNDGTHTKVCTVCDLKTSEDCTKIKQDDCYVCGLCNAKYEIEKPTEPSTGENPTEPSTEPSTNVKPTAPEKESTTNKDTANSNTESTTKEKVTDKTTAEKTTSKSVQKNNSKTSPATGVEDMTPLYITVSVITVIAAAAVIVMISKKRNAYSE